ncbi:MAG: DsbA family protein [Ectothiorhodospiraceae bacterium]|nr:DsbA family protein [Ectothiorhodospiraceae bacterium]
MARLEWFFDVICPQTYLAATRMETLARQADRELVLRPVSLARMYATQGLPQQPEEAWPENKRRRHHRDILRQAELAGLKLRGPLTRSPGESEAAQRLLAGAPENDRAGLMHRLLAAAWERGSALDNIDLLKQLASEHGSDPALVDSPAGLQALERNTEEALERGVFGVPTATLGDRMWWGADRIDFLSRALGITPSPTSHQPDGQRHRLEVFHDFSSPFSYLACTQVERIARDHGAELVWRPMLLGALFRSIGTPMVPLQAMSPNRQRWGTREMSEWASHWGVPFRFTSHFPLNTVLALRVSAVEPDLIQPLYRAAWAEDRDLGDQATVAAIIQEAGKDADTVMARATTDTNKALIRTNTEAAEALGACGAPTLVVDGRLVFWGQDRLDMVGQALDGWVPEADAEAEPAEPGRTQ